MSPDAVLKIGGSLSRGGGLESLCREISRLSEHFRLLIVPGGGPFADQVRNAYTRFDLDETAAHQMALLAMDQYGYVLRHLIVGSVLATDLSSACRAAEAGKAAILLPSTLIIKADPLPHSWQVTSDSIAAWIAHQVHCDRFVLLKDVEGLLTSQDEKPLPGRLIPELTPERLAEHKGGVDEYLFRFLASARLETWVINGLHPQRLVELLEEGYTTGTRIRCS